MNADIRRTLVDTFGRTLYVFVIFFFFIFILYIHNEVPEALKEACTASLSFLSALATLGAAYIASSLFNDWKTQFNKNTESEYLKIALEYIREIQITERQCKIAIKESDKVIKYGILGSIKNDVLDSNNSKLIQILFEYCTLLKDNELRKVVKHYQEYTFKYTFILATIKLYVDPKNISNINTSSLDMVLKSKVIINQQEYLIEDIFVGLEATNLQQEIFSRLMAK